MRKIKLALVDDHTLIRQMLATMLRQVDDFDLILEATNGQEFIDKLPGQMPDVVLLDVLMPILDGPATVGYLREAYPQLKVIMLIVPGNEEIVKPLLGNGICAYWSKHSKGALESIKEMIRGVADGEIYETELVWRVMRRPSNV